MLRWAALLLILLAGGSAQAAFTGLTLIPTADVLAPWEAEVDLSTNAPVPLPGREDSTWLNTQCGLGTAEVGIDFDFSAGAASRVLLNGKLQLRRVDTGLGVAAGAFDAGKGVSPTSYVVATAVTGSRARVDAGLFRTPEGANLGFLGLEYDLTDHLQLWAEAVAAREDPSALTLNYLAGRQWAIALAWQRLDEGPEHSDLTVDVGYTFSFGPKG